ncbi:MAG: hypothetical protein A2842_02185 [Candidatus Wildermuthbacteria bacterium RIFCSPHIGHO2_01_FULL_48_25]|nr:MAG: hypothetical protein A2842_02185 [Candidatus Wildermuthbacteria bacterium RIFCSPHIGHO2_01_FULL_48_25]OHA69336.1 MAG: hypothetical protein A3J57_02030 [Candidatus Wildermuthbacteria bacterium RIFCSPHIGHO2_02_FULL_49_12b]
MNKFLSIAVLAFLVAGLTLSFGVSALEDPPAGKGLPLDTQVPGSGAALLDRIDVITNWVFAVFVAISVIFIVLAAFQFVTAGGKPEEVSMARQKLIYAVIGIAIALLARALPAVLRNILIT